MNMPTDIQTLRSIRMAMVVFRETIRPDQLRFFRGAMIALAEGDMMFHNHRGEGFSYAYPKIQYKLIDSHPSILGVEDGAAALLGMMSDRSELRCRLGRETLTLHVHSLSEWVDDIGMTEAPQVYAIEGWMPLNTQNFKDFSDTILLTDRIRKLEGILTANILSFAKGIDVIFGDTVRCRFCGLESNGAVSFKKVEMLSFSGTFITNVILPKWIGLGKSASLGHGTVITSS